MEVCRYPSSSSLSYDLSRERWRGSADQCTSRQPQEDQDACHKYAAKHRTLTPGIFTLYCTHGVCCGFQVMLSHESPISTRFETPPTIIIYDNSCKLHQYILNRQPSHFKNTRFSLTVFTGEDTLGALVATHLTSTLLTTSQV